MSVIRFPWKRFVTAPISDPDDAVFLNKVYLHLVKFDNESVKFFWKRSEEQEEKRSSVCSGPESWLKRASLFWKFENTALILVMATSSHNMNELEDVSVDDLGSQKIGCSSAVAATCDALSIISLVARKLPGASFSLVRKGAGKPLLH